jgi:hypothetical protein
MAKPWPLLAALNLFVSPVLAHQEDSVEPERRPRSAGYDLEKLRTKRYGALRKRHPPISEASVSLKTE